MKVGEEFKRLVEARMTQCQEIETQRLTERFAEHKRILLDYAAGESIANIRKKYGYSHMQVYRLLAAYDLDRRNEKHHTGRTIDSSTMSLYKDVIAARVMKINKSTRGQKNAAEIYQKAIKSLQGRSGLKREPESTSWTCD